jgi:hypothetical protein
MIISSIMPDIRLFSVSSTYPAGYPASQIRISGIQPDTGYKKGRIIRPDIQRIPNE